MKPHNLAQLLQEYFSPFQIQQLYDVYFPAPPHLQLGGGKRKLVIESDNEETDFVPVDKKPKIETKVDKTAVFAFGRMNPPTVGHKKIVDQIKELPGEPYLFLSHTQKPKTDPLTYDQKVHYAKQFFSTPDSPITIGHPDVKTIIHALKYLYNNGYKHIIYVAGSDRYESFKTLINKYNGSGDGKLYNFETIQVINAGERDPDSEGVEGMSASKMRKAVLDDDKTTFHNGTPDPSLADEMFDAVKAGLAKKPVKRQKGGEGEDMEIEEDEKILNILNSNNLPTTKGAIRLWKDLETYGWLAEDTYNWNNQWVKPKHQRYENMGSERFNEIKNQYNIFNLNNQTGRPVRREGLSTRNVRQRNNTLPQISEETIQTKIKSLIAGQKPGKVELPSGGKISFNDDATNDLLTLIFLDMIHDTAKGTGIKNLQTVPLIKFFRLIYYDLIYHPQKGGTKPSIKKLKTKSTKKSEKKQKKISIQKNPLPFLTFVKKLLQRMVYLLDEEIFNILVYHDSGKIQSIRRTNYEYEKSKIQLLNTIDKNNEDELNNIKIYVSSSSIDGESYERRVFKKLILNNKLIGKFDLPTSSNDFPELVTEFVNKFKTNSFKNDVKVVYDMTDAGTNRTVTEYFGYQIGLPSISDHGIEMLHGISKRSIVDFNDFQFGFQMFADTLRFQYTRSFEINYKYNSNRQSQSELLNKCQDKKLQHKNLYDPGTDREKRYIKDCIRKTGGGYQNFITINISSYKGRSGNEKGFELEKGIYSAKELQESVESWRKNDMNVEKNLFFKFMSKTLGDLGQILYAATHKLIFATEDRLAGTMALMLYDALREYKTSTSGTQHTWGVFFGDNFRDTIYYAPAVNNQESKTKKRKR